MPTPRVSIGLPVYNGQRYLQQTLDSILGQTCTDFELVISDNASTDRTPDICAAAAARDGRIKYHRNPVNLGAAPNYNLVFEHSSGAYFKLADYDDLLPPTFVAECVEVLDRNPKAAVVFPKATLIDEHGAPIRTYDPLPDTRSPGPHERFRNLVLAPDHYAIQASGMMRASMMRQTVMHRSYPSSDEVFLAHMALMGEFVQTDGQPLLIRVHPRQSTKGAQASERARVLFFDTSLKGKVVLIKWLYFKDCLSAIRGAPLSARQRLHCYATMLRWLCVPQHFRSMGKDMLLAIHQRVPLFPGLYQEAWNAANKPRE
jgi:glycosyltransferase involved in cell wall biosynthesis